MKEKIKAWLRTKGKELADRWVIFLVMLLVSLALILLAIPMVIFVAIGWVAYILGAGLTAICNQIFYQKPVDETFEDLYSRLLDKLFNFFEN